MNINFIQAVIDDAELLVNNYNTAFYDDYVRFGSCPGYGQIDEKSSILYKMTDSSLAFDEGVRC